MCLAVERKSKSCQILRDFFQIFGITIVGNIFWTISESPKKMVNIQQESGRKLLLVSLAIVLENNVKNQQKP